MKKRRRLSRAHRAKIAKGLRRYYRKVRVARARRNKRDRARRALKKLQAKLPKRVRDTEEWELTFRYSKKGRAIGWTMRIVAPRGTPREIIEVVAQRRGQGETEPGFRIELGNWQQESKSGRVKEYPAYEPQDVPGWHALFNARRRAGHHRRQMEGVDMRGTGKLRLERVRDDE